MSIYTRLPVSSAEPRITTLDVHTSSTYWPPTDDEYGLARVVKPARCGYPVDENIEVAAGMFAPGPKNYNVLQRSLYTYLGIERAAYRRTEHETDYAVLEVSLPPVQALHQKLGALSADIPDFEEFPGKLYSGQQFAVALAAGRPLVSTEVGAYPHDLFVHYLPGWALVPPRAIENDRATAEYLLELGDAQRLHEYMNHVDNYGPSDAMFYTLSDTDAMYSRAARGLNETPTYFAPTLALEPITAQEVKEHHDRIGAALEQAA